MTEPDSLFHRLGARAAVSAAVSGFYARVLTDPLLQPFFEGADTDRLVTKQEAFLTQVFGGPETYDGPGLRATHRPLVRRGLSDEHFDAVAGHLAETLLDLGVTPELAREVLAIAESTREDVLDTVDTGQRHPA